MSAMTSATTWWRDGLERVCRTCERSRSAFYARRARVRRPLPVSCGTSQPSGSALRTSQPALQCAVAPVRA